MKINLCKTEEHRIVNYINIHPYGSPSENNDVFYINYDNLDSICCDGEAEEIRVNDVLAYIPQEYHQNLVNYWAKKLMYGGTISFVGFDSLVISRALSFNQINNTMFNQMLYTGKQSAICVAYLLELLKNAGLFVKSRKINTYNYIVIGERSQ